MSLTNKDKANFRELTNNAILHELENQEFVSHSKDGKKESFSRNRTLSFRNIIILIVFIKGAVQRELDNFYKTVNSSALSIRCVTKSAFSQARAKLSEWAFVRLNDAASKTFYENADYLTWNGMRVFAVDGTGLLLPNSESVIAEFGSYGFGPKAKSMRSMALASICYDLLNQIVLDAQIAPYSSCERSLLAKHLDKLGEGDLLLLDRGYPSYWVFFLLSARKIHFCVRMKGYWWKEVEAFQKSTDIERIVKFTLPKKDHPRLSGYPEIIGGQIACRLVKVKLPTGEIEVICTSLLDTEVFPAECFQCLYDCRWDVEEAYKIIKRRIDLEDFSGRSARAVKQDFHAKILLMTLAGIYSFPVSKRVEEDFKAGHKRKHDQQINHTQAVCSTKEILAVVFVLASGSIALAAFDSIVYNTREIIRPGRTNPRNHRQKKPHYMAYKRL